MGHPGLGPGTKRLCFTTSSFDALSIRGLDCAFIFALVAIQAETLTEDASLPVSTPVTLIRDSARRWVACLAGRPPLAMLLLLCFCITPPYRSLRSSRYTFPCIGPNQLAMV